MARTARGATMLRRIAGAVLALAAMLITSTTTASAQPPDRAEVLQSSQDRAAQSLKGSTAQQTSKKRGPLTVTYVEVNSSDMANVANYQLEDGSRVVDIAIIFAANIDVDEKGEATLFLNERVQATLDDAENQIRPLQEQGTKVTLSLLGNHSAAGFANFESRQAADKFAGQVADVVRKYDLDGVDIDDEWVQYGTPGVPEANPNSGSWLVTALDRRLPRGSSISLYDIGETAEQLQDASRSVLQRIDYIWNPYYGTYKAPEFPVKRPRLGAAAIDLTVTSADTAASLAARTREDGYGTFVTYNLTAGDHSEYMSSFTRELYGQETVYTG